MSLVKIANNRGPLNKNLNLLENTVETVVSKITKMYLMLHFHGRPLDYDLFKVRQYLVIGCEIKIAIGLCSKLLMMLNHCKLVTTYVAQSRGIQHKRDKKCLHVN